MAEYSTYTVTDNGDGTYTHKIVFDPDIKKRIELVAAKECFMWLDAGKTWSIYDNMPWWWRV
jgi:hypothetical protein